MVTEDEILHCLQKHELKKLREIGIKSGFLNRNLRSKIWPMLTQATLVDNGKPFDENIIKSHPSYHQVVLDVQRTFVRFLNLSDDDRIAMQDKLTRLIIRVLINNADLSYYQGYHDVCIIFLQVLGEEKAFHVISSVSKTHLSIHLESTITKTISLLECINLIIEKESTSLSNFIINSKIGNFYSLSWVVTWFSHNVKSCSLVERLFDLFLSEERFELPIYLSSAILLSKKDEILQLEREMSTVHTYITSLIEEEKLDFEKLIHSSLLLMDKYPISNFKTGTSAIILGSLKKYILSLGFFSFTVIAFILAVLFQRFYASDFSTF